MLELGVSQHIYQQFSWIPTGLVGCRWTNFASYLDVISCYCRPGWTIADNSLAEGVGFEPTIRLPVYTLSRRAPSTTRPPLRSFSRHPSRRILRSGADRTPKARRAKPDQPKRLASTCRFLRTSPIDKRALAKIKPSPMATTLIAEPSARGAITSAAERACANYPPVLLPPRQRAARKPLVSY
jgi:hypothetical protein